MEWGYDPNTINDGTEYGKINAVRLLIGDNDPDDKKLQNPEIQFALEQNNDNLYLTASFCCDLLSAKYSSYTDVEFDESIKEEQSQLASGYRLLSQNLKQLATTKSKALYVYGGGVFSGNVTAREDNGSLVKPSFKRDQFKNE